MDTRTPKPSPAARSGLVLLAAAAFLLTGSAIRALVPAPWFEVTAKLRDLERRADEIDCVVIGNSRIYRGLVPEAFDERLAERGIELRTYNLGGPGMGPWESNRTLERVLQIEGLDLRYVLLQVGTFGARIEEQEEETRRGVDWHTFRHTYWVLRAALHEESFTTGDRLQAFNEHGRYFLRWLTSYGMALDAWKDWTQRDSAEVREMMQRVARERGFVPLGVYEPNAGRRERFLDRLDKFDERVQRGRRRVRKKDRARAYEHGNPQPLIHQIARIEAAGVQPVYLVEPQYGAGHRFESLVESGLLPNLLNIDDPLTYPHLFRADRHYDKGHLNQRGAVEFSQALADRFADWLEAPG